MSLLIFLNQICYLPRENHGMQMRILAARKQHSWNKYTTRTTFDKSYRLVVFLLLLTCADISSHRPSRPGAVTSTVFTRSRKAGVPLRTVRIIKYAKRYTQLKLRTFIVPSTRPYSLRKRSVALFTPSAQAMDDLDVYNMIIITHAHTTCVIPGVSEVTTIY